MGDSFKTTNHHHGGAAADQTSPVPERSQGPAASQEEESTFPKPRNKRCPGTLAGLTGGNCPSFVRALQLFYILSSMRREANSTALTERPLASFWCRRRGHVFVMEQLYIKFDSLMEIHFHSLLFPIDYNNSQQRHLTGTYDQPAALCSSS